MDTETEKKIVDTVVKLLRNSDTTDKVTEYIIRKSASENLGINLSAPVYKEFVRQVVEAYLTDEEETQVEEEKDEDGKKKIKSRDKECDDEGGLIVPLSKISKVTVTAFGGKPLVSIHEFYKWHGKEIPTSNGVSLTSEEWEACSTNVTATEKAIRKMEARLSKLDYLFK